MSGRGCRMSLDQERIRFLTKHLSLCIWETDADLRMIYFQGELPAVAPVSEGNVLGNTLIELHENAEHGDEGEDQLARLHRREPFADYEIVERRPDGGAIFLRVSGTPQLGSKGEFLGYRGTIRDVSAEAGARSEGIRTGAAREREILQEAIE